MESWLQTFRRSPADCAQDRASTGTLRLSFGDLTPRVSPDHLFTVSVTLVDAAIDHDEMIDILRHRLAPFHLLIVHDHRGQTVLVLTVEAADLWLAVLRAMNGVTATGYLPVAVTAQPAEDCGADEFRGVSPSRLGAAAVSKKTSPADP
jgi:hypothetical protein